MYIKEKILKELSNEINANKFYKKEVISYLGRTDSQARELLQKILSGEFDAIFTATSHVLLNQLSMFDLARKNSSDNPTIREYRKYVLLDNINRMFKNLNYKEINNEEQEITGNKCKHFIDNLYAGVYDGLLDQPSFWFADDIDVEALIFLDNLRSTNENYNMISLPNYIVATIYYHITKHIENITREKERTGKNKYIQLNGREQSPITKEEFERLRTVENKILSTDYDWREARNVVEKYYDLDIYHNDEFPHNIEDIINCFKKEKTTLFDTYDSNVSCYHNTDTIVERAKQLADGLTPDNFCTLFLNKNEDDIDTYLREMIVSQFDGKLLANRDYSAEQIKSMLNNPHDFSEEELRHFFLSVFGSKKTIKSLYDIANGTLYSLYNYKDVKLDILKECVQLQKELNCFFGTVSNYDYNSVALPNGKRLISMPAMDIEDSYTKIQKQYEYCCTHSSSDLELVESCIEVFGRVITSQIFREGNKRTARCLFNAMMISNGIVPPIIDLTADNLKLWYDFACNVGNQYLPAKKSILEEVTKVKDYFKTVELFK